MRWVLKCLSIRFRERGSIFVENTEFIVFGKRDEESREFDDNE